MGLIAKEKTANKSHDILVSWGAYQEWRVMCPLLIYQPDNQTNYLDITITYYKLTNKSNLLNEGNNHIF